MMEQFKEKVKEVRFGKKDLNIRLKVILLQALFSWEKWEQTK